MSDFDKDINVPINDCISRKAAIDAVSKGCQEWRGIFGRCEENILALPSAQPEIVRCEDCKYNYANMIPDGKGCQRNVYIEVDDNFFCADGEREVTE